MKHGARVKRCEIEGCTKYAKKRGICCSHARLVDESTAPLWGGSASYNDDTTVLDETLYPLVSGASRDSGVPRHVIVKAHAEV